MVLEGAWMSADHLRSLAPLARAISRACNGMLALPVLVAAASAAETVTAYHTDITLSRDGSVELVETITANVEGRRIKHGLFLDRVTGPVGTEISEMSVSSVERDSVPEPFRVEPREHSTRVWMGAADVLLDPGLHTWVIHYRLTHVAVRATSGDTLSWHVTGQFQFRVATPTATLHLPAGVEAVTATGSIVTGKDPRDVAVTVGPGFVGFAAGTDVEPGEDMVIAVTLPVGTLTETHSI